MHRVSVAQFRRLQGARLPRSRKRAHPEDDTQREVCRYWALAYPHSWALTFHSPQGMAARNRKLAAIFAGLGVKPGVFDLLCIQRRGSFNGLALELKATRGRVSDAQQTWAHRFKGEGWSAHYAYSIDEARAVIDAYHRLPAVTQEGQQWTKKASCDKRLRSASTPPASAARVDAVARSMARGTPRYG